MRTRVGHGDFVDLIWVEPDLATATLEDARGEPLLELERNHVKSLSLFSFFFCVVAANGREDERLGKRGFYITTTQMRLAPSRVSQGVPPFLLGLNGPTPFFQYFHYLQG